MDDFEWPIMTEPSDIVERLKTLIALHPFAAVVHTNGDGSQIIISEYGEYAVTDAIAEITRLRAALAEQKEACARVAEKYGCGNPDCEECYGNIIAAAIRARASATPSPADAKQKQP